MYIFISQRCRERKGQTIYVYIYIKVNATAKEKDQTIYVYIYKSQRYRERKRPIEKKIHFIQDKKYHTILVDKYK